MVSGSSCGGGGGGGGGGGSGGGGGGIKIHMFFPFLTVKCIFEKITDITFVHSMYQCIKGC